MNSVYSLRYKDKQGNAWLVIVNCCDEQITCNSIGLLQFHHKWMAQLAVILTIRIEL